LNLRERFEQRCGKVSDELYRHVLDLALDDQKQFIHLSEQDLDAVMDPVAFPPSNSATERIDEIRERLLESMEIIADIVQRINRRDQTHFTKGSAYHPSP